MSDDNSTFLRRLQRELAAFVEGCRLREMVTGFDGHARSIARIGSDDHKCRAQSQRAAIPAALPGLGSFRGLTIVSRSASF